MSDKTTMLHKSLRAMRLLEELEADHDCVKAERDELLAERDALRSIIRKAEEHGADLDVDHLTEAEANAYAAAFHAAAR